MIGKRNMPPRRAVCYLEDVTLTYTKKLCYQPCFLSLREQPLNLYDIAMGEFSEVMPLASGGFRAPLVNWFALSKCPVYLPYRHQTRSNRVLGILLMRYPLQVLNSVLSFVPILMVADHAVVEHLPSKSTEYDAMSQKLFSAIPAQAIFEVFVRSLVRLQEKTAWPDKTTVIGSPVQSFPFGNGFPNFGGILKFIHDRFPSNGNWLWLEPTWVFDHLLGLFILPQRAL